jgi:2-iminobutanoate/2-iminopropanoate deaminase
MQQASIVEETEQVLQNLQAVLKAGGSGLDQVVKCSIFLTDMGYFQEVNEVYSRYFTGNFPARETVAVKALPAGARVEISCVAVCF